MINIDSPRRISCDATDSARSDWVVNNFQKHWKPKIIKGPKIQESRNLIGQNNCISFCVTFFCFFILVFIFFCAEFSCYCAAHVSMSASSESWILSLSPAQRYSVFMCRM